MTAMFLSPGLVDWRCGVTLPISSHPCPQGPISHCCTRRTGGQRSNSPRRRQRGRPRHHECRAAPSGDWHSPSPPLPSPSSFDYCRLQTARITMAVPFTLFTEHIPPTLQSRDDAQVSNRSPPGLGEPCPVLSCPGRGDGDSQSKGPDPLSPLTASAGPLISVIAWVCKPTGYRWDGGMALAWATEGEKMPHLNARFVRLSADTYSTRQAEA